MKVMFIIENMKIGGAQRQIVNMANYLSQRNIEISVFTLDKSGGMIDQINDNVKVVSCFGIASKIPFIGVFFQILAIIRKAKTTKPDVIYCRLLEFPGVVAGKILNIPIVVAEIKNPKESVRNKLKFSPLKSYTEYIVNKSVKTANVVVANSSRLAVESQRYFNLKTKPLFIYNGLDIERIKKESYESITHPWLDNKEIPVIVSVGRLVPAKGFFDLLESINILKTKTKFRLIVVGDGKLKRKNTEKIDKLELKEFVSLVGNKKNPYPFMKAADVYVSSSIYEGFSNSLLEALALGLPIVSTNHDFGANEMIEDGKSGLLVPVSDPQAMAEAILKLLQNKLLMVTMGNEAKERAKNFTIEKTVSEYEKLFREVVS